ncbi:hypothetical protein MKW98_020349 [Papaver atlanticum]|uniref:Uncharacterized protein n=1 Tax=Papaver atlanticum TaxID=357466 RepID=A0AAD4RVT0_9MAGN|nr:hypothetical protein MKW98_020349 [Papaver atlanticum]
MVYGADDDNSDQMDNDARQAAKRHTSYPCCCRSQMKYCSASQHPMAFTSSGLYMKELVCLHLIENIQHKRRSTSRSLGFIAKASESFVKLNNFGR